ncbi:MAG: hypothetical protein WC460_04080 [Patescibacteria group bacterium]
MKDKIITLFWRTIICLGAVRAICPIVIGDFNFDDFFWGFFFFSWAVWMYDIHKWGKKLTKN